jgi:hypothetical protein
MRRDAFQSGENVQAAFFARAFPFLKQRNGAGDVYKPRRQHPAFQKRIVKCTHATPPFCIKNIILYAENKNKRRGYGSLHPTAFGAGVTLGSKCKNKREVERDVLCILRQETA